MNPTADYAGDDGFVLSFGVVDNGSADACAAYAASPGMPNGLTTQPTTWHGRAACQVTGTIDGPAKGLIVPLPEPFDFYGTTIGYAALLTDPSHFDRIASTVDLTKARVTPVTYLSSVINLIEARSWYTEGISWDIYRPNVLELAAGYDDMEDSAILVGLVLGYLQQVGDRHSFMIPAADTRGLADTVGLGMLTGGNQIVAVYEGSPADLAGVRRGDVILAIDDIPYSLSPGSSIPA